MRRLARDYVDRMAKLDGTCDVIEEVTIPYPLIIITSILGLPNNEAPLVLRLTQKLFGAKDP